MKRLAASVVALVALAVGLTTGTAQAADGGPKVQTSTVSFVLTSATCSHLPPGTTINGSGTQRSLTIERSDRSGARTIKNVTVTNGRATDQNGKAYVFHYANEFHISNTTARPSVFSGSMSDVFVLGGTGPARLRNGFVADFTTNADLSFVSSWHVRHAFGDPISFQPGPFVAHCDPL